jgi:hypothetical protein
MAALIYFGEMLVSSLLAVVLLAISPFRASSNAALFAAGVVAWTLAEYVVHRFVLHGLVPTQHALHHANPDTAVLNIFWQIWACFALVYLTAGGAFLAGGLVAYAWYLFVHHCAHHDPERVGLHCCKAAARIAACCNQHCRPCQSFRSGYYRAIHARPAGSGSRPRNGAPCYAGEHGSRFGWRP